MRIPKNKVKILMSKIRIELSKIEDEFYQLKKLNNFTGSEMIKYQKRYVENKNKPQVSASTDESGLSEINQKFVNIIKELNKERTPVQNYNVGRQYNEKFDSFGPNKVIDITIYKEFLDEDNKIDNKLISERIEKLSRGHRDINEIIKTLRVYNVQEIKGDDDGDQSADK